MWGQRWWKNRFRVHPTQVIAFIENGLSPGLLDVRTKGDHETSPPPPPGPPRRAPPGGGPAPRARGFRSVRILKGGLGGWTNARLPVEAKASLPSIGLELYKNLTAGDSERRRFKAGEVIFHEGDDPRDEAFLVHSGTLEIRRTFDGQERVLSRCGEGGRV